MHMYENIHRHSIEGGGRGSLLDQPHPSSSSYNTPSGYSEFHIAPKERATLSMEQVRPVQEVMAHRLGGHKGQERDGIHCTSSL